MAIGVFLDRIYDNVIWRMSVLAGESSVRPRGAKTQEQALQNLPAAPAAEYALACDSLPAARPTLPPGLRRPMPKPPGPLQGVALEGLPARHARPIVWQQVFPLIHR